MAKQVSFNGYLLRQFGAYIRTDLSALVQVNGVASGIIGIMGLAEKGPVNKATTVSSYTELVNTFGDGPLVRHGLAAYVGGANTLVAVRLDDTGVAGSEAEAAKLHIEIQSEDSYTFSAREKGTFGNGISVKVDTPRIAFSLDGVSSTDAFSTAPEYSGFFIPEQLAENDSLTQGSYVTVPNWDSTSGFDTGSYTVFAWNGSRWSVANVGDLKTRITTRVGSIEESLDVPYFINEVPWVKALSNATPEDAYYYVLLNTSTQQVREIPRSWLAGLVAEELMDLDEFIRVVNDFKGEDEILFNGTVSSEPFSLNINSPTPFPFELIKHIVNFGGFGSGPSSIITLDLYEGTQFTNPQLIPQGFTELLGGTNSEDGTGWLSTLDTEQGNFTSSPGAPTTAWEKAFEVMENEEVNFVQPAYIFAENASFVAKYGFFKALAAKVVAHVNLMSNTPNRKFRTSILGLPSGRNGTSQLTSREFLEATEDISGTINSDRIQLWGGGFFSTALEPTTSPRLYGAEWLASFAVGAHAAREVSVSLTFAQLAGIFTDGLEYAWTTSQKDEMYGRSLAFALKRRTSTGATEFVAAHNYTSFTGAPSRGLQLFITRRIVDYMNSFVYKNLEENFIGAKSRGAETANRISAFVEALLRRLIAEDTLVAYEGLNVVADENDKTIYYVEYSFQPVTEINFLLTTNKLVYNLA